MKTKILSITLVLSLLLTMLSVPVALADVEDIVVYSQNFDSLIGANGKAITGKDEVIAATGEKAESASTVKVVSESEMGRFLEGFTTVADTSGLANVRAAVKSAAGADILSGNENSVMTVSVENKVLKLDKTATGKTANVNYDFTNAKLAGDVESYTVEFDLKTAFKSTHTVNVTLGADFSIRCADYENQLCTIEWHDGSAWINTDKTKYDFSDFTHITLAVRTDAEGTKTVDLYVGSGDSRVLVYENVPQRNSNNFKKLNLTVGSGAICQMYIDNIGVTEAQPKARGDVFHTENFDGLESLPAGFVASGEEYGTVSVADDALVIDKTQTGGAPGIDFAIAEYLKNTTSYSIAFDLKSNMTGSTAMLYLGAGIGLRPVENQIGIYTVEYYYNAQDETETSGFKAVEGVTADLNSPVNFRIEVTGKSSANIMINGEYLMASESEKLTLTQRSGFAWDKFAVRFGNGAIGTMTIDNIAITRGTAVYTAPEGDAELDAANGFMQIAKLYNYNGSGTRFNFSNLLCSAADYTASMKIYPVLTAGSANIYMGAFFELVRTSEGVYRINYREGTETSNKVLAENIAFDDYRNLAIKVTNGTSFALYLDGELIKDGIIARDGYSASDLYIFRNNGMMGNIYVDDLKLTLHTERATGTSVSDTEDFESFTTGPVVNQVGSIRTTSEPTKGVLSVEKVDDTHGNALRLYSSFVDVESPFYVSRNHSDIAKSSERYTVEFEIMLQGKQSYSIAEKRSGNGGFKLNFDLTMGYVKYQKNGTWVNATETPVVADKWYKVKYDINTAQNLADVYIDDVLLVEDLDSYQNSPCGGIIISTNTSTQGSMYFDNLKVTPLAEKEAYVSAQYEDGTVYVDGYMPTGADSRLFIAYFDAETNGTLLDVDIIPCKAGKVIEKNITEIPEGAQMINVMLWEADITPVCANSRLSIVEE